MFFGRKQIAQKGFTLIELMVAIAIIGLLMAAGLAAYANIQKTARDSRRLADIDAAQKALEQYYFANGFYPKQPVPAAVELSAVAGLETYFSGTQVPNPPTTGASDTYQYIGNVAGTGFCVCAGMIENPSKNGNEVTMGTVASCGDLAPATGTDTFCRGGQQ